MPGRTSTAVMPPARKPIGTGGPRRDIDDDALVKRYVRARAPATECARAFRVSRARVKAVLAAHDIELRARTTPGDARTADVFRRQRTVAFTAQALGTDDETVRAALGRQGITPEPRPPRCSTGSAPNPGPATGSTPPRQPGYCPGHSSSSTAPSPPDSSASRSAPSPRTSTPARTAPDSSARELAARQDPPVGTETGRRRTGKRMALR